MELAGRRIVITGATGGLGPSLVDAFLAQGAQVIAASRREEALDALRVSSPRSESLEVVPCDATDAQAVAALFRAAEARGAVHAVVHAVGAFVHGPFVERTDDEIERVLRANVLASAWVVREALRTMLPRAQGRIVLVAADRALRPAAGFALYGAAKAAVVHLVEAVAEEVHRAGVRIHALLPGVIDTADNRAAMPSADPSRWVRPTEVAKAAVWLTSPESRAANGALIRLPGG